MTRTRREVASLQKRLRVLCTRRNTKELSTPDFLRAVRLTVHLTTTSDDQSASQQPSQSQQRASQPPPKRSQRDNNGDSASSGSIH